MIDGIDIVKQRREHIRWILLRALDNARPGDFPESRLLQIIVAIYQEATAQEVRRELSYLEDRRLVEISGKHTGTWRAELRRHGVDIVEYTVTCEPGIARPPKVG